MNNKHLNTYQYLFGFVAILFVIGLLSIGGKAEEEKKALPVELIEATYEQQKLEDFEAEKTEQKTAPIYTKMFTKCSLNLRKEPNPQSKIQKTVEINTELDIKQGFDSNGWKEILYDNQTLYVNGSYLSPEKVEIKKPVVTKSTQSKPAVNQNIEIVTPEGGKSIGTFKITHYAGDTMTSTGVVPTVGRTIAVDPRVIPYGSKVVINGHTYIAEDCGGAVKGNVIDIFVSSVSEAYQKGVYYTEVYWA